MKNSALRTALFWTLAISTAWECLITISLFARPELEAAQFGGTVNEQTVFFSNILGGFMILFSSLCGLCSFQLKRHDPSGRPLALLIGVFWIYMGLGLYLHAGAPAYVLIDPVRGLAIVFMVWRMTQESVPA